MVYQVVTHLGIQHFIGIPALNPSLLDCITHFNGFKTYWMAPNFM